VYRRNRTADGAILGRAVRTRRYRLVEWKKPGMPPETVEFELYDYEKDPLETKNLASMDLGWSKNFRPSSPRNPRPKHRFETRTETE